MWQGHHISRHELRAHLANTYCYESRRTPPDSLIAKYTPYDYIDTYTRVVASPRAITPEDFSDIAFDRKPAWMRWVMQLRDVLVKPFKLDNVGRFTDMIREKSTDETVFGKVDRHLTFHASLLCGKYIDGKQELRITTVVKYNNMLGKVYFFIIRPFHAIIVKSLLNKVARSIEQP